MKPKIGQVYRSNMLHLEARFSGLNDHVRSYLLVERVTDYDVIVRRTYPVYTGAFNDFSSGAKVSVSQE